MKEKKRSIIVTYLLLIFFAVIFILPIMMLIFGSLKVDEQQILSDLKSIKAFLPTGELGLANYKEIFTRIPLLTFIKNSIIITVFGVIIGIFVASSLGFALARLEFKGKKMMLSIIICLMIIPSESIVMTQLSLVNAMNLINTLIVQTFPSIADIFIIHMFYQAFLSIPKELEESAIIDGLSYPQIYFNIVMPLIKPTTITAVILSALARWGDVLWPTLVVRTQQYRPLAVGVNQLFGDTHKYWGDIFASSVIMILPILLIYLIFQKQFVSSVTSSGIKG